jgi:hypothetical protein
MNGLDCIREISHLYGNEIYLKIIDNIRENASHHGVGLYTYLSRGYYSNIAEFISSEFSWTDSNEGHGYWENLQSNMIARVRMSSDRMTDPYKEMPPPKKKVWQMERFELK